MKQRVIYICGLTLCLFLVGCGREPLLDEADVSLIDARQAIADGDKAQALALLDASIAVRPNEWAYYERGRLHAENGDDDAARADVEAGLELDPQHSELLWLEKQLKRPQGSRFKGRSGQPPQVSK